MVGRGYIDGEAVLVVARLGEAVTGNLRTGAAVFGGVEDACPRRVRTRHGPAQVSDWRRGIGNAFELAQTVVDLAAHCTVAALYHRGVGRPGFLRVRGCGEQQGKNAREKIGQDGSAEGHCSSSRHVGAVARRRCRSARKETFASASNVVCVQIWLSGMQQIRQMRRRVHLITAVVDQTVPLPIEVTLPQRRFGQLQ